MQNSIRNIPLPLILISRVNRDVKPLIMRCNLFVGNLIYVCTFALTKWLDKLDNTKDLSTEQRIFAAAKKIFVQHGMTGARMQDIADEAGINKAMLHYYFRSKEKLFEMIFREAMGKLLPKVLAILNGDEPLFTKIERFCEEYIGTVIENPYIPLFVIYELNRDPNKLIDLMWQGGKKPGVKKMADHIGNEIKKGSIKPIEPLQLILNMMSLCVFPFVAKPMFRHISGMSEEQYTQMLEMRKTEVSKFIIASIKT
jgi:AcrR family transcriptional regulator